MKKMINQTQELEKEIRNLERDEKIWEIKKKIIDRKKELRADKMKHKFSNLRISTSKKLIIFLFANCSVIEFFTGWTMVKMLKIAEFSGVLDFTPLVALIGAIVGEVIGFAVYSLKAAKENSINGITYELAMRELSDEDEAQG